MPVNCYACPILATNCNSACAGGDGDTPAAEELIALVRKRDEAAVRTLVARYNRHLFRIARGLVRDDNEAEDIVQETYVRAFTGLHRFRGDAAFSTWITRIALNEAYGRLRRKGPTVAISEIESAVHSDGGQVIMFRPPILNPESETGREQVRMILERAIDQVPEPFRMVFILRDLEGHSTDEAAAILSIKPETVKTRLFRARRLMRTKFKNTLLPSFSEVFPFGGYRCARMADWIVERLQAERR
ncbi:MAG: RNA polymerase sigma factor [Dehalococcoidia bacterium]